MTLIQVPILFPESTYKTLKIRSKIEGKPMADLVRSAVKRDLGKNSYRSPLLKLAGKATGSLKSPKKDYSKNIDKVLYGNKNL